ncbi:hypothetical protein PAXINDRAFT_159130, partial [Paxillus involutus ATCC 200175]
PARPVSRPGKGSRHESILVANTGDIPSLTNIGLRVFMQSHPEERENSFWHTSKSSGDLWTLSVSKGFVYNLGESALNIAEGRYHALKPWAFKQWEALGRMDLQKIIASQFKPRSRKKQNCGTG